MFCALNFVVMLYIKSIVVNNSAVPFCISQQGNMFRLQQAHIETIVEFMEGNPDFAKGRLSASNARDKFKTLWLNLSQKLNALGLGERSIEKWQKTWSDYKGNLKKKAAGLKKYQDATGGGPPPSKTLTDFEVRLLNVLGTIFYAGVGVEEKGICISTVDEAEEPTASGTQILPAPDHDYLVFGTHNEPPKKKVKKDEMAAYEETITCLKSIENTLQVGLHNINKTLTDGFNLIAKRNAES